MPLEYGPQNLYPGARCSLFIRFDEFDGSSSDVDAIRGIKKPITQITGSKDPRGPLKVVKDPASTEITRFLLLPPTAMLGTPASSEDVGPFADDESSDGLTHRLLAIIPKKADWKQNGLRMADTLTLDFRWRDMPIDPRVIRSCAVKFYAGTLSPAEFSAGIAGQIHEKGSHHRSLSVLPDSFTLNGRTRSNLRFLGWVDKWEMVWDDNEPMVRLECADNTRLLLKQPQPARGAIDMVKPIDEAIADYLTSFPQLGGLTVEYRPNELPRGDIPTLKKALADTTHVPNLGPSAKGSGDGEDDSVWDYLDTVVGAIGHTIRIDGTRIIIQQSTAIYDGRAQPRLDDAYQPRKLPSGEYDVRTFIWGRNISELKVGHEYAKRETKGIEARCYLPERKKPLIARFPEENERPTHPLPGAKGDAHWQVIRPKGIKDEVTLKRVAQEYYNNVFRNELAVSIKTKNLSSFGGDGRDPDVLDMKPGDNFRVLVARGENESVQSIFEGDDPEKLVERFTSMGYTPAFANAYVNAYLDAGFQTMYRAKEIGVTWDVDEGISIELSGHNYIEARVDKPLKQGADPTGIIGRK